MDLTRLTCFPAALTGFTCVVGYLAVDRDCFNQIHHAVLGPRRQKTEGVCQQSDPQQMLLDQELQLPLAQKDRGRKVYFHLLLPEKKNQVIAND